MVRLPLIAAGTQLCGQAGPGVHVHLPCHLHTRTAAAHRAADFSHLHLRGGRRPFTAGVAPMFPNRDTSIRDVSQGGIGLVDIRGQLAALQAKVIARLLEPEFLPWKSFFDFWLYRSSAWLASQAQPPAAPHQHVWQLGRFLPFSSYALAGMAAPQRVIQYITAFRQLQPHRLQPPEDLSYQDIMGQPLFHNKSIRDADTGQPLQWLQWARQGIVRVGDLRQLMAATPADAAQIFFFFFLEKCPSVTRRTSRTLSSTHTQPDTRTKPRNGCAGTTLLARRIGTTHM